MKTNWTNKKATLIKLFGEDMKVKDFTEVYELTIKRLYEKNPVKFEEVINKEFENSRFCFSEDKEVNQPKKICSKYYLETKLPSEQKRKNLIKLFKYMGYENKDLKILSCR